MTARRIQQGLALATAVALLAISCSGRRGPAPILVRAGPSPDSPLIVIIKSGDNELLDAPIASFIDQSNAAVTVFGGVSDGPELAARVRKLQPKLLLVLGTKATVFASRSLADVPTIFTMVVNYRRLELADSPNRMGIQMEIATASEFSQFKMVAPTMTRVLTFYTEKESKGFVEEATREVSKLGVELVAVAVKSAAEIEARVTEHEKSVDGIWLLNDPVVMNPKTFQLLRERAVAASLPFMSSLSDKFARAGALMSVSTDLSALGAQAAGMARMHLEQGMAPKDIGVQPPISSNLVVNIAVAEKIGLIIPDEIMPFISTVGDHGADTVSHSGEGL